jgi:hypothetical protein
MRTLCLAIVLLAACGDDSGIDGSIDEAVVRDLSTPDLSPLGRGAQCYSGINKIADCATGLQCCLSNCTSPDMGCLDPPGFCLTAAEAVGHNCFP